MMKNKRFIAVFLTILSLFSIFFISGFSFNNDAFAIGSSSEIVMEVNSKRILHQNDAFSKRYMASTTKILTAIVVIENCNVNDEITIKKETTGVEGSSIYLEEGEKLSVLDLLYGLMLRSGNDCAETLAVHCSGDIKTFALLMNQTAKKIGATNSNFVNPHGLHDDNHYTTAYDLALISCYAMKNPTFRKIVKTKVITIPFTTRNYNRKLINKNKMLTQCEGATGIKTGYTKKAGRCLVSSSLRNGMELISVVLNSPPMFERSKELLDNCFNNFELVKVFESDYIVDFIPISDDDCEQKCGIYIKNDVILPLNKTEKNSLNIVYDYPKKLRAPIEKDSEIGTIKIYSQNNLLFEEKIYNIIKVS